MGGGGRRRNRALSEEERVLWDTVARSVAPLEKRRRRRAKPAAPAPAEGLVEPAHDDGPVSAASPTAHPPHPQPTPPPAPRTKPKSKPAPTPLAPIDTRTKRKLVRGTMPIEERLDLHGMTQHDAHQALRRFLAGAQARGARMVIVITGKGRPPGAHDAYAGEERGVLRRVVPHWLALPDMRDYVVGFEEAHAAHGGGGALYVRLRRSKRFLIGGEP